MIAKTWNVSFEMRKKGQRVITTRKKPPALPGGRIPRIARLMALAHHLESLVTSGRVKDYAELARLGHVSRARITQIMNLLLLAPDIQEAILFLPKTVKGHDPIKLKHLQAIALDRDWGRQRERWRELEKTCGEERHVHSQSESAFFLDK